MFEDAHIQSIELYKLGMNFQKKSEKAKKYNL